MPCQSYAFIINEFKCNDYFKDTLQCICKISLNKTEDDHNFDQNIVLSMQKIAYYYTAGLK